MNLPRHTLSSHASSRTFVDARFHHVKQGRDSQGGGVAGSPLTSVSSPASAALSLRGGHGGRNSRQTSSSIGRVRSSGEGGHRHYKEESKDNESLASDTISLFACATRQGYFIARTHPLEIVTRREFTSLQGGLSHVSLIDNTSLLVLVGGGRVPRFAPNKVIFWDEEAIERIAATTKSKTEESSASGTLSMSSSTTDTISPRASTLFSASREGEREGEKTQDNEVGNTSQLGIDAMATSTSSITDMTVEASVSSPVDIPDDMVKQMSTSQKSNQGQSKASVVLSPTIDTPVDKSDIPFERDTGAEQERTKIMISSSPVSYKAHNRHPSLASTTQPAESMAYTTRKGREVAELEFGETVKDICVNTFQITSSKSKSSAGSTASATILVVVLDRKAVVFEMGSHVQTESLQDESSSQEKGWGIRQRIVVDVQPGLARGMASLAPIPGSDNCVLLALPGRQAGHVQLLSIALSNTERTSIRSSIAGASTIIAAHTNPISSLTLSHDGSLLCTTSERGTLLRIWSTFPRASSSSSSSKERRASSLSTSLVSELRRGSDSAKIWSIAFSPDSLLLAAASDTGTIHFFDLQPLHEALQSTSSSQRSSSSGTGLSSSSSSSGGNNSILSKNAQKYLPTSIQQVAKSIPASMLPQYVKSQWSFAQYKVPLKVFSSFAAEGGTPRSSQSLFGNRRSRGGGAFEGGDDEHPPSGNQLSLEGGWASMKGRIEDVRRGEKGIEERIWLDWIAAASDESTRHTPLSSVRQQQQRGNDDRNSSPSFNSTPSASKSKSAPSCGFELVAITSSGSQYRIGISSPSSSFAQGKGPSCSSSSTVLDMYREDAKGSSRNTRSNVTMSDDANFHVSSSDSGDKVEREEKSSEQEQQQHHRKQCWLVEFQRFGMRDEWID